AFALGVLRAATTEAPRPSALEPYVGQLIRLGGRLDTPPNLARSGASVRLALNVDKLGPAGSAPGSMPEQRTGLLAVVADPAVLGDSAVGDYLVLEGRLRPGDGRSPPTLLFPRLVQYQPGVQQTPLDWLANLRTRAAAG